MRILKKLLIVATAFVIVGFIGTLLTFKSKSLTEELIETKEMNRDFTRITIESDNAAIEVIPSHSETTKVEFYGNKKKKKRYEFTTDVTGETLTVSLKEVRKIFFKFFYDSVTLKVYIPEKMYENVQILNDNGTIEANTLQSKELRLQTDNGRIVLEEASAQQVNAHSSNGEIYMKNITATNVETRSDNGTVSLTDVTGDIIGKVNNGQITLKLNDLDRNMELEADNGKIVVYTANEPTNATINTFIENGKTTIFGKRTFQEVYGAGEYKINLAANNGKITVDKR